MAKARPWNRMLTDAERISLMASNHVPEPRPSKTTTAGGSWPPAIAQIRPLVSLRSLGLRRVHLFPYILDVRESLELDIGQLAVLFVDAGDIDVLDDIVGVGVDRERAARAGRRLVGREDRHRLVAVELAAGFLDDVVHHRHAVPALDGGEIGDDLVAVFFRPSGEESLIRGPDGRDGIGARVDDAQRRI